MNENINLEEILRDCPKGTEFYSPIFGKVTFDCIICSSTHPIKMLSPNKITAEFTSSGKYYGSYPDSECLLFPSKDQRDWNVWKKEQDIKAIWDKFEDGDYLQMKIKALRESWLFIYKKANTDRVSGYGCLCTTDSTPYPERMSPGSYIGFVSNVVEIKKATPEQIAYFNQQFEKKYKKQWNPATKEFEKIKTEMTISEIEKKLGLTSGSLRIKK